MAIVKLPKTVEIAGRKVRIKWETLDTMDGWYAEINKKKVRELELDDNVHMQHVEDELAQYGDYARYGQESDGSRYLCLYIKA